MRGSRFVASFIASLVIIAGGTAAAVQVKDNVTNGQRCDAIQSRITETGEVVQGRGAAGVVALGDSYTAGDWLEDRSQGWAYAVAADVAGVGMTGYTNGGYCGGDSFSERLSTVTDLHPSTLIIQGGLNDSEASAANIEEAASDLLEDVAGIETVVLVGPTNAPAKSDLEKVDRALAAAAADHQREYVSTLGWDLEFLPDRLHLTPAGHAEFAELVKERLN